MTAPRSSLFLFASFSLSLSFPFFPVLCHYGLSPPYALLCVPLSLLLRDERRLGPVFSFARWRSFVLIFTRPWAPCSGRRHYDQLQGRDAVR